jgi:hypothetical protein
MRKEEIESLVAAYCEFTKTPEESPRKDELFWSFEKLFQASQSNPDLCWKLILAVLQADQSDCVLAQLAAGPVEELLIHHGAEMIDRVEERARVDSVFRSMLGGIWRSKIALGVWNRVVAARGP